MPVQITSSELILGGVLGFLLYGIVRCLLTGFYTVEQNERVIKTSAWRYRLKMEAALITEIHPPQEVESALAAINTAHNQVSSEISLAQAAADQKIVQSKRAVEIETLKSQAEVEPLQWMATQLLNLKQQGPGVLQAYLRNIRLPLFGQCHSVDFRLDQRYLRSQPVNSEEGAPMGIGVWYEMWIDNPISFLFKNSDPQGSRTDLITGLTIQSDNPPSPLSKPST